MTYRTNLLKIIFQNRQNSYQIYKYFRYFIRSKMFKPVLTTYKVIFFYKMPARCVKLNYFCKNNNMYK